MYSSVMTDIETLSTAHNAVVASAAFVTFDLDDQDTFEGILKDKNRWLLTRPNLEQQQEAGQHLDASTVKWWMVTPGPEARLATFAGARTSVPLSLGAIIDFFHSNDGITDPRKRQTKLWGNGATFDNVILRSLFKHFERTPLFPVPFWHDTDLRTLEYLARSADPKLAEGIKKNKPNVPHDALHDAIHQVICAQQYYQLISGGYETVGG